MFFLVDILRTEHPNPQFQRNSYECLNGEWGFDFGDGHERVCQDLPLKINVPFTAESVLSGIGHTEIFTDCVYTRLIDVTAKDLEGRLVIHFGAVDYKASVYVNGKFVTEHVGGYTPFEADIAPYCSVGKNRVTVCVHDDVDANTASGKQSNKPESFGCFYTRTTGIWQTVWLERTPKTYVRSIRVFPNVEKCSVEIELNTIGGAEAEITVSYKGKQVGYLKAEGYYCNRYEIALSEKHLWEVGHGRLYDLKIKYGEDEVESYFGLREVKFEGMKFLLNGECVYQRLVLDQGYYRKGIYTAETEEELVRDIYLSLALGYNGARLHQKVFEPRFLYHCDKLGYIVWGEYPSWGVDCSQLELLGQYVNECTEMVERDFNHPSIITWCPINEAWMNLKDNKKNRDVRFIEVIYTLFKALDKTRPCVDVSGGFHCDKTDLYDFHCYLLPEELKAILNSLMEKDELPVPYLYAEGEYDEPDLKYEKGLPVNCSEYGGSSFVPDGSAWGYHSCATEEEFVKQYVELTELLIDCPKLSGLCYTQLYDVEQEQNGLYDYDRNPKFTEEGMAKIKAINQKIAAIEKL